MSIIEIYRQKHFLFVAIYIIIIPKNLKKHKDLKARQEKKLAGRKEK